MGECAIFPTESGAVVSILSTDVSPILGKVFICYVTISIFVTTNLMMSVFMEMVIRKLREDLDPDLAERIENVFSGMEGEITWETFNTKLETSAMKDYLKSIDVYPTPDNAKAIFDLIDLDGGGTLSAEELVNGALRLRGPGRALEMSLVLRDTS